MSGTEERWLGPGEAAAKLGVTVKALRVYEREALSGPIARQANGALMGRHRLPAST